MLHAGGVGAFGCPDPGRAVPWREPQLGVGQPFPQRELAQPGGKQRLERVGQRAAEQFHGAGVDQSAQQGAAAMPPQCGEVLERPVGLIELANAEGTQCFRCARQVAGRFRPGQ